LEETKEIREIIKISVLAMVQDILAEKTKEELEIQADLVQEIQEEEDKSETASLDERIYLN